MKRNDKSSLWSFVVPILFIIALTFGTSCSNDKVDNEFVKTSGDQVLVYLNMPEYEIVDVGGNSTRGIGYDIGDNVHVYWKDDVAIGVFPVAPYVSSQSKFIFHTSEKDSLYKVQFSGEGWGLKEHNTYAAYYPYHNLSSDIYYDNVPVSMDGQKQVNNTNMDHIGEYECMFAPSVTPQNSSVVFNFDRENAFIWLRLVMRTHGSWKRVTLTNTDGNNVFVLKGKMNISTGEFTPVESSTSISLDLQNVYSQGGDTLNLFIAALPTRTGPMRISLYEDGAEERIIYATTPDIELVANRICRITRTPEIDQQHYVDLDLPSGTLWAKCNLGATFSYDTGQYFSWGATSPDETYYFWSQYPHCMMPDGKGGYTQGNTMSHLSKYTIPDEFYSGIWYDSERNFIGDNLRELQIQDDAAYSAWGGEWRVPTKEQFLELIGYCEVTWDDNYEGKGHAGYKFTGENGNHIFLPAAGWIGCENEHDIQQFIADNLAQTPGRPHMVFDNPNSSSYNWKDAYGYNSGGYYWTCNLSDEYSFDAVECKFTSFTVQESVLHAQPGLSTAKRYLGCSIRPVRQPETAQTTHF